MGGVRRRPPFNRSPSSLLSSSRPTATDAELVAERDRLLAGAARLEAALDEARARADADAGAAARERAARGAPDESQVWASHLVVLQDTLRMHREEAGAAEVELAGRARMAAAAAERAAAEAAGRAAAARARAQLLATEARIDRLKMELYFPKVKGYSFAVGGKGIYFGGKDIVVAEASGPVAFDVCPPARPSVTDAPPRSRFGRAGLRRTRWRRGPRRPRATVYAPRARARRRARCRRRGRHKSPR